jgi:hypothetical protein
MNEYRAAWWEVVYETVHVVGDFLQLLSIIEILISLFKVFI